DDHGNRFQKVAVFDLLQNLQAVQFRKLQVEQDQVGVAGVAFRKRATVVQIIDRGFTIFDHGNVMMFLKGLHGQFHIHGAVFGQQNVLEFHEGVPSSEVAARGVETGRGRDEEFAGALSGSVKK